MQAASSPAKGFVAKTAEAVATGAGTTAGAATIAYRLVSGAAGASGAARPSWQAASARLHCQQQQEAAHASAGWPPP